MIPRDASSEQLYRLLPSLDKLMRRPEFLSLAERHARVVLVEAARAELAKARTDISHGVHTPETVHALVESLHQTVALATERALRPTLVPVLNATGVILHTNLGRAPLSEAALQAVVEVARGYSNLEFDLDTGTRGQRDRHAEPLLLGALATLAGQPAEKLGRDWAVAVVNNCAAATFLALDSLARGGEVLVSRGELVEIGGGFRVPDILRKAGVTLREVGTTNRTRIADYAEAVGENTRMILRVHPSNFKMEGFTERPGLSELVELGRRTKVMVFEDQGTGLLLSLDDIGINGESSLLESFRQAPDLVAASGDKLLGGPQCGLLLGRHDLVKRIRANPLFRALRVDKLTYAALQATLIDYAAHAEGAIPTVRMLRIPTEDLRSRCDKVREELANEALEISIVKVKSVVGGGTTPGAGLDSVALSLRHRFRSAAAMLAALRRQPLPVIGRIQDDCVLLDLRTVPPEQDAMLARAVRAAAEEDRR